MESVTRRRPSNKTKLAVAGDTTLRFLSGHHGAFIADYDILPSVRCDEFKPLPGTLPYQPCKLIFLTVDCMAWTVFVFIAGSVRKQRTPDSWIGSEPKSKKRASLEGC